MDVFFPFKICNFLILNRHDVFKYFSEIRDLVFHTHILDYNIGHNLFKIKYL